MQKLDIKPLSANQLWRGRKFKTTAYKVYEKQLLAMLAGHQLGPFKKEDKLELHLKIGFSNKGSDLDNVMKAILDTLQKHEPTFNDSTIYSIKAEKYLVSKKGDEFILFELNKFEQEVPKELFKKHNIKLR